MSAFFDILRAGQKSPHGNVINIEACGKRIHYNISENLLQLSGRIACSVSSPGGSR
jgi:lipopolysaccharide export system protein LptA